MIQRFILSGMMAVILMNTTAANSNSVELPAYLADSLPARWCYEPEYTMEIPDGADAWWQSFGDSVLNHLISAGMTHNYNVAMALKRTAIARNAIGQARAGWMPSVSANAGWTKERASGMTTSPGGPATGMSYFTAGLSASWEIDIFGKIASGVKAKKASYMATKAEQAGTMVSVCAQIAATYIELRMYQELRAIALEHTAEQMKIVNIAKARFETTLASKLDVAQALETYYSTTASIPMLENSVHKSINALAVLTGERAETIEALLGENGTLPDPVRIVSTGVPADILRRRPDIAQAEMEVAEYAAEVGIAKKDFLPTLRIDGEIGTSAHNGGDLFSRNSFYYSVTPTLSWTLFEGMERKFALASAKETLQAGIDNYNLTVANAIQETDNAISTYHQSLKHMEALTDVIRQNDEALQLAVERYKTSLSPMSDVVTAQLNSLEAASNLVMARGDALSALISLYEALGGGFDSAQL